MICYVFDLDNTLIPTHSLFQKPAARRLLSRLSSSRAAPDSREHTELASHVYRQVVPQDPSLIHLISKLRGSKVLLTNGTRQHGYNSLAASGLLPYFYGQVDRESGAPMKPAPMIYNVLRNHVMRFSRVPQSQISYIFFDDLEDNLLYPKRIGWTTVWIASARHNRNVPNHVDYVFDSIHRALQFFLRLQKNRGQS